MKIGIIGYGKMGREIERIAQDRGHEVIARISSSSGDHEWELLNEADVCIEFSNPNSALTNFLHCFENGFPIVTGTTGWYDKMGEVQRLQSKYKASFFWASNFSLGVNLFWQLNEQLARLMNPYDDYSISLKEIHHTEKLDAPSGTAITTAEQIIRTIDGLDGWKLERDDPNENELPIEAVREADVKGTHSVTYDSEVDKIELKHEAKSRAGFAIGAVLAAEFLQDKHGFFTMKDLLKA
ncbi:MAG: 4-hydroxy-tetrahydrodipicolinate reductase [Bacteroidetes bacterium]|nr:4-hydroxy-tetrahydrodipicolinate reductase [Bacteroidota bacterium]